MAIALLFNKEGEGKCVSVCVSEERESYRKEEGREEEEREERGDGKA